jgi:urea carboxylase
MFKRVLIANRGEIAVRILRTLDALGIESIAVYAEADEPSPHVSLATQAYRIGPAPVNQSYLNAAKILEIARASGAEAIHPGYGLLSENAAFAEACETAGITFIGPTPAQLRDFGLKHEARRIAEACGLPLCPGTPLLTDSQIALSEAHRIGFPVMVKSTSGGGGIGMQVCHTSETLEKAFAQVEHLGESNFGQKGVFIEKFIEHARHLEVQIFGDGSGNVISLGVRDCSTQRRNQKVIEETPPAGVPESVLSSLESSAVRLAKSVNYRSAGTVEFIYDLDAQTYYFLEVNTRLQVEHGVTEAVTGIDLVEWMIRCAAGTLGDLNTLVPSRSGHAIQARIYAEDPSRNYQPSTGLLTKVVFPNDCRVDTWIHTGTVVTPYYDPLLAKLIVYAADRPSALRKLQTALLKTQIHGLESNLGFLSKIASNPLLTDSLMTTRSLSDFTFKPDTIDVLLSGTMTTVQDYPGRLGRWDVGVPPSGPMDALSFRLANGLVGNTLHAAGLEITASGPRLKFNQPVVFALTGAIESALLNGIPIQRFTTYTAEEGSVLDLTSAPETGVRSYLAIQGGLDVPDYLGSKSTFTLGQFGGHGGRALRTGDVLRLARSAHASRIHQLTASLRPTLTHAWKIGVLYGPHGAPDYFTEEGIQAFFETQWEVHYNSARTGVRLIGPKPLWARRDGGEAGLHPSNIHDNAYAVGAIDFTGEMPVILGPDGPSLGGFVCPATIIKAELWKMGQLRPGDRVEFICLNPTEAKAHELMMEKAISELSGSLEFERIPRIPDMSECILYESGEMDKALKIRQSGDSNILIEFGAPNLSLDLRFHAHVLYTKLMEQAVPGVIDLTPGIRSLQIHFDTQLTNAGQMTALVCALNASLPPLANITVESRILHLPLSWDDPATQLASRKYMQSVNATAPWCPDNIEFIRRINGLDSIDEVKAIIFNASYVVLGLGDVYLGAPVATPLDPCHRLVTTKYNPARTWTPENAVGIGGAYMCIYGMEGPGGYQMFGRTIQMWNRFQTTRLFPEGSPWLLRFFDQIRFYPVSAEELLQLRIDFPLGRFEPKVEKTTFTLKDHHEFRAENAARISAFKARQEEAFHAERLRWEAAGIDAVSADTSSPVTEGTDDLPPECEPIASVIAGSLWQLNVSEGTSVKAGEIIAVLESMKMEIPVEAPADGILVKVYCKTGQAISPGQRLFALKSLTPATA